MFNEDNRKEEETCDTLIGTSTKGFNCVLFPLTPHITHNKIILFTIFLTLNTGSVCCYIDR